MFGIDQNGGIFEGFILDDGNYYLLLSDVSRKITSVLAGSSTFIGNTFSSTDGKNFSLIKNEAPDAVISARLAEGALKGNFFSQNTVTSFETTYVGDYDETPRLEKLAGSYTGSTAWPGGEDSTNVTIERDGFVTGLTKSGCAVAGVAHPRTKGNIFNVSMSQGGAPCGAPHQVYQGVIYQDKLGAIYIVMLNAARDSVTYFSGKK